MENNEKSTVLTNVALIVVVILAALVLFSHFLLGVEVFQCMSEDNRAAQADCLQRVVVEHLNRGF